jgi:ATP-binding cassette subfamily F protein 3
VIFVSHDRYFIDRLATRVLEIEGGRATMFEGNYEDYLRKKEEMAAVGAEGVRASQSPVPKREGPGAPNSVARATAAAGETIVIEGGFEAGNGSGGGIASPVPKSEGPGAPGRARRLNPIKQRQMEERCAFLEEEVPRVEAALAHTEQQLGVYVSAAETERLVALAGELRGQLAALTAEWEELMVQLEGA